MNHIRIVNVLTLGHWCCLYMYCLLNLSDSEFYNLDLVYAPWLSYVTQYIINE